MAGMTKGNTEVLISDVYTGRSVWREDDVNFRRKDVTNKLWEEVAMACGMTSGPNDSYALFIKSTNNVRIYSHATVCQQYFCLLSNSAMSVGSS
jgi:hypothetical protein